MAGKDASKQFWKYHNEGVLKKYKSQLQIGSLDTKKKAAAPPTPPATPPPKKETPKPETSTAVTKPTAPLDPFGDLVPFADPSWYQGVSAPRRLFFVRKLTALCC